MPIILETPIVKTLPVLQQVTVTKVDIKEFIIDTDEETIEIRIKFLDANGKAVLHKNYTVEGDDYTLFTTATNPTTKIGTSLKRLVMQYLTSKGIFSGTVT